jgi:hypothetical protein
MAGGDSAIAEMEAPMPELQSLARFSERKQLTLGASILLCAFEIGRAIKMRLKYI